MKNNESSNNPCHIVKQIFKRNMYEVESHSTTNLRAK